MQLEAASTLNNLTSRAVPRAISVLAMICLVGCGTTKTRLATDQLLVSDAVDQAITGIDFGAMAGQKVYFDSQYIKSVKGIGFVNSDYIISSLRQQMVAADCRLQEDEEDADFVVEARVGTLGTTGHEVVYGVPANNALSTAATFIPNTPAVPAIPELSFAKKDAHLGAAKIAVFAYERESRRPVWQSGTSQAKSTAQDYWVFGAGPFQRGSIYEGTQFAGSRIRIPRLNNDGTPAAGPAVSYRDQFYFPRSTAPPTNAEFGVVGYEQQLPPVVLAPTRVPGSEPVTRWPEQQRPVPPPTTDTPLTPPPTALLPPVPQTDATSQ
ncbi:MAG: hypothetical protein H8E66_27230 [Planctomycetes bacterium]|nr:hypothetical protein [Planctomycetota bacterium]